MPGYFGSFFDDDEPQSFFGGYRPRAATAPTDPNGANASLAIPVSDQTPVPNAAAGGNAPDFLTYPDSTPVVDPNTGEPYLRPSKLDVAANVAFGKSSLAPLAGKSVEGMPTDLRDIGMVDWLSAGAPMDYQRPNGYLAATNGDIHMENRNVTNYNMGALAAAAGYSLEDALQGAGLYNRARPGALLDTLLGHPPGYETPYGLKKDAVNNITQGWKDATDGKWTK